MEKSKGCFYVDPEPPPLLLLTQITTEANIVEQGWRVGWMEMGDCNEKCIVKWWGWSRKSETQKRCGVTPFLMSLLFFTTTLLLCSLDEGPIESDGEGYGEMLSQSSLKDLLIFLSLTHCFHKLNVELPWGEGEWHGNVLWWCSVKALLYLILRLSYTNCPALSGTWGELMASIT